MLALEQPYVSEYAGYAPFDRGSDGVIDAYNATLRQVASRCSARVVADHRLGRARRWSRSTACTPNDAGHRHLAQAVVRTCRQSFWFTDQKAAPSSGASALRSAGRMSR